MIENKFKITSLAVALSFSLVGCINTAEKEAKAVVTKEKEKAKIINKNYKTIVSNDLLKNVSAIPHNWKLNQKDPFRIGEYFVEEKSSVVLKPANGIVSEERPKCIGDKPPVYHKKSPREMYALSQFAFLGAIRGNKIVALIKTPEHGVVSVEKGSYIGKNNGIVSYIGERRMVVVEKIKSGCRWKNSKVILKLK